MVVRQRGVGSRLRVVWGEVRRAAVTVRRWADVKGSGTWWEWEDWIGRLGGVRWLRRWGGVTAEWNRMDSAQ